MKNLTKFAVWALASASFITTAYSLTYRDKLHSIEKKTIPFQLKKGTQINEGIVKYDFQVRVLATQTGAASTLFHPIDDRACSINVYSQVVREVCFTTILGEQSCHNKYSKILPVSASYTPHKAGLLDADPCNDFDAKMESLKIKISQDLQNDIGKITDSDLQSLKQEWGGQSVEVTYSN